MNNPWNRVLLKIYCFSFHLQSSWMLVMLPFCLHKIWYFFRSTPWVLNGDTSGLVLPTTSIGTCQLTITSPSTLLTWGPLTDPPSTSSIFFNTLFSLVNKLQDYSTLIPIVEKKTHSYLYYSKITQPRTRDNTINKIEIIVHR